MLQRFLVVALSVVFLAACGTGSNNYRRDGGYSNVVPAEQSELEAKIGDRIFFDYNSSELTVESKDVLKRQAEWLKDNPAVTITVEGHADERGTKEYNLALGERRAQTVKNYLVSQNVNSNRINTISYGNERPAVLGKGEEVWSQNRRAVSIVNNRTL